MPLRLPTRHPPKEGEEPFKRRTPPTPQATRLMRLSLAAGILFVVILGVVFVPTALHYGSVRPPVVTLAASLTGPFNVTVTSVTASFALGSYYVWLNVTAGGNPLLNCGNAQQPLVNDTAQCGGVLTFLDLDGSGTLSVGDVFRVLRQSGSDVAYSLSVFNTSRDQGRPECPCAAGAISWR